MTDPFLFIINSSYSCSKLDGFLFYSFGDIFCRSLACACWTTSASFGVLIVFLGSLTLPDVNCDNISELIVYSYSDYLTLLPSLYSFTSSGRNLSIPGPAGSFSGFSSLSPASAEICLKWQVSLSHCYILATVYGFNFGCKYLSNNFLPPLIQT